MRPTAVAGPRGMGFYTDDPERLAAEVDGYLAAADPPELDGEVVAVMVPHAGLAYSGPIAAFSYLALQGSEVDRVVLIGASHRARFRGAMVSPDEAWDTPLGPIEVDPAAGRLAALGGVFGESRAAHSEEHSLEVQLPFIARALPAARIVPILVSQLSGDEIEEIADGLAPLVAAPGTVLVASSDMVHYPVYDEAVRSDRALLAAIETMEPERVEQADEAMMAQGVPNLLCTLCGMDAVLVAMAVAKRLGEARATVLDYRNSGDTAGDKGRCVGYGAVAFTVTDGGDDADSLGLTDEDRVRLLRVARQALEARLAGGERPSMDPEGSEALARETACFVTLKRRGKLRGCIGELEPSLPLIEAVAARAVAAATGDPRFPTVRAGELDEIEIDISAMSPLRRIDSPEEFIVGQHGIVVRSGMTRGVFLPQVAPEQGWDHEQTLTILCRDKAGLPADAWRTGAELWVFTADVFSEAEFGLGPR